MFQGPNWLPDRMELNGFTYRLEYFGSGNWDGGDHFTFYKIKSLVDQFEDFFSLHKDFLARNVFELGIGDGGSAAFWCEILKPQRLVAIDLQDREDSDYFKKWASLENRKEVVKSYWRTDQSDRHRLRQIVSDNFSAPLDLVIDDASHLYSQSKATFEALFPLCRPGAIYILEDWAWDHWETFSYPSDDWALERRLTDLVVEFIEAAGTATSLIQRVEVYQGFAAIIRGSGKIDHPSNFSLDDYIVRRPKGKVRRQVVRALRLLRRLRTLVATMLVTVRQKAFR